MSLQKVLALVAAVALAGALFGQEMKPLSAADKARVEELLKNFDPNSYSLDFKYETSAGKTAMAKLGKAKGLASVRQTAAEKQLRDAAASTNVNNNIFKTGKAASSNVNNNIFRVASTNVNNNVFIAKQASSNVNNNIFKVASTNVNNNIFIEGRQAAAAAELNTILQKYAQ